MKRSGVPARAARKRTPESSQATAGTKYKAAAIAELIARISQRNRHAETTWGTAVGRELW
jgi:antitoxin component of MazEF toxin-antitoxin module